MKFCENTESKMAAPADEPKEVKDFSFRSMRRVKIQTDSDKEEISKTPTQRLAVANSIGFLFAGK